MSLDEVKTSDEPNPIWLDLLFIGPFLLHESNKLISAEKLIITLKFVHNHFSYYIVKTV